MTAAPTDGRIHGEEDGKTAGFWGAYIISGWWFGTFYIFPYIGNSHPNWLTWPWVLSLPSVQRRGVLGVLIVRLSTLDIAET